MSKVRTTRQIYRELAEKIAADLMTYGPAGDDFRVCERLALILDGREVARWSQAAMARQIERHLMGEI